jgi:uncharacterized protein YndB with AHSA1/START domain
MTDQKIIGTLYEADGRGVVRMEETYATDIHDLWAALTQPARLARWIAEVEGDLRVGGEFTASFTSSWNGRGRVDVCDAPNRLEVTTWETEADSTTMVAALTTEGDRTRLVIEERGLPLDSYHFHGSGWQVHIEDLGAYLSGQPTSNWADRWRELQPVYEAMVKSTETNS